MKKAVFVLCAPVLLAAEAKAATITALGSEFTDNQIGMTALALNPGGHAAGDTSTLDITLSGQPNIACPG